MKYEKIFNRIIQFDEIYYIAYAGGKRELPENDMKRYNKIALLPDLLQPKEKAKIPFDKNPNVVPVTGMQLLEYIKEYKFIPFFDLNFEQTHLLQLTDIIIYESIKQKNYQLAMK